MEKIDELKIRSQVAKEHFQTLARFKIGLRDDIQGTCLDSIFMVWNMHSKWPLIWRSTWDKKKLLEKLGLKLGRQHWRNPLRQNMVLKLSCHNCLIGRMVQNHLPIWLNLKAKGLCQMILVEDKLFASSVVR